MNIVPWIRFCSFEARHLKLAFLSVKYGSVSDVPDVVLFSCSGVEVVDIVAEDLYSNIADISIEVSVTIQPSGPVPKDVVLPALENNPVRIALSHGMARLPRLALCSRVGNHIGDYLLVFSAPGVQSQSVKFAFSTGRFFFVLFRWKEFNLRNANQFVEAYATFSFVRPRWGNVHHVTPHHVILNLLPNPWRYFLVIVMVVMMVTITMMIMITVLLILMAMITRIMLIVILMVVILVWILIMEVFSSECRK